MSKVNLKTPKRRQGRYSGVCIVNFEYISHYFRLLTSKC